MQPELALTHKFKRITQTNLILSSSISVMPTTRKAERSAVIRGNSASTLTQLSNVPPLPLSGMYFHGNMEWSRSFGSSLTNQMPSYLHGGFRYDRRQPQNGGKI